LEAGVAKLQGALTVAEDKIKALEAFQAKVDAKIDTAAAKAVADAKTALEAEAALIRSEMQNVRDRVAAAEAAIQDCATKSDFEAYKAQVAAQIEAATKPIIEANTKLAEALGAAQGQINLLLGQYKGVVDAQAQLKIDFDNLNKAFTAAQVQLGKDLLAMSNRMDAIDIRITTEVNNITGAISILNNAISTLENKVITIDTQFSAAIDAINVRLNGIDQSIIDANALIETKYQAALAEILRQRGQINSEIAEINSTLDDLDAADKKEAQARIKGMQDLYIKLGVEIVKAREAAIDAAAAYTDQTFAGVQALIDAVDATCADLKTALDALTVRVEKLETDYNTLMGIVEGLINQIQSIVPIADKPIDIVEVETNNGITTGTITYLVNTNADEKLFETIVSQCDFSFMVNDYTTRALTDLVWATIDEAKIAVDAVKRTITVPFTLSKVMVGDTTPSVITEMLQYSLALKIVDPTVKDNTNTKTNITSSFVNLWSTITVALDANDVHFNFKKAGIPETGDGVFSAEKIIYDANTLRDTNNNRRGYNMVEGAFNFADVFGVRSYTITDPLFIGLYDVKLVAAYNNNSGSSADYGKDVTERFQILDGSNTLSIVSGVDNGQAYTIVVELQAKDVEKNAKLGKPQYAAFNLTIISINDVSSIELAAAPAVNGKITYLAATNNRDALMTGNAWEKLPQWNKVLTTYNAAGLLVVTCKNKAGNVVTTPNTVTLDFTVAAVEGYSQSEITTPSFLVSKGGIVSLAPGFTWTNEKGYFITFKVQPKKDGKAMGDAKYFAIHAIK
ncbi:MAG: hypothetical protein RR410_08720, partial [Alistipes sp.]